MESKSEDKSENKVPSMSLLQSIISAQANTISSQATTISEQTTRIKALEDTLAQYEIVDD